MQISVIQNILNHKIILVHVRVFIYRNSTVSATTWPWSSSSPPKQRGEEEEEDEEEVKRSRASFYFPCDQPFAFPLWWPFCSTSFASL